MTFLLNQLFSFVRLLNSDQGSKSIALGVAFGLVLGFSPTLSLQSVLIYLCLFFFRVQMGAAFISAVFFALVAFLFDPLFHEIGTLFLEADALESMWTALYQMPIVPFTRFYNSVVMGSGIVAIMFIPVVYLVSLKLVEAYRVKVVARFRQSKFFKAVASTKFYGLYNKWEALRG